MLATAENIVDLLSSIKGARVVTITTKTEPALTAGNPFDKDNLFKISRVNGMVNWNYANSVNRQLGREGQPATFAAEPRKWGTRLQGLPFVVHTKDGGLRLYLEMKVERSLDYHYEDANGNPIDKDMVNPWLKPKGKSRQNVEKEVMLRDYRMDHIIAIATGGTVYIIEDNLRLVQDIAAVRS